MVSSAVGLPLVGAQAVMLGMAQFNLSVAQITRGLTQVNAASKALETSTLTSTARVTGGFANMARGINTASSASAASIAAIGSAATLAGAAVVAAGLGAVAAAANFEKALKPAQVFANLTTQQTDKLTTAVINLSNQWGVTTSDVAEGATELVKAGNTVDDLTGGLLKQATALNIASNNELTLADSAKLLTQILRSYNLTAADAGNVTDVIVAATNHSTAGYKEMQAGLGQVLPFLAQFGMSIQDGVIALGLLNDANIRGERAGSTLRNLFIRMLDPSKEVTNVMIRYGVSLQDASGHIISMQQFIERLNGAFSRQALAAHGISEATAAADLATLGMSRSVLGALALAQKGTPAYQDYAKAIAAAGHAEDDAQAMTETTVKQLQRLFVTITNLGAEFGGPFNSALGRSLQSLNDWLAGFNEQRVRAFGQFIYDNVVSAFNAITDAARVAAAAGTDFLTKLSGQINTAIGNVDVNQIIRQAQDVYNQAVTIANQVVQVVTETYTAIVTFINETITTIVTSITGLINSGIQIANAVTETVSAIIASVVDVVTQSYNAVATFINQVITRLGQAFQPLLDFLSHDVVNAAGPLLEFTKIVIAAIIVIIKVINDLQASNTSAMRTISENVLAGIFTWQNFQKAIQFVIDDFRKKIDSAGQSAEILLQGMQIVLQQWTDQWRQMANSVTVVVKFIGERIAEFMEFLSKQPIIGDFVKGLITQFNQTRASIDELFNNIGAIPGNIFRGIKSGIDQAEESVNSTIDGIITNIQGVIAQIQATSGAVGTSMQDAFNQARSIVEGLIPNISAVASGAQDFLSKLVQGVTAAVGTATPAVAKFLEQLRTQIEGLRQGGGVAGAIAGGTRPNVPQAGGDETAGFPVSQAEKMTKFIQDLLKNIPGVTKEFAQFIAELVDADPSRLQPIVNALNSQAGLVRQILEQRRQLLQTEISIAEADQRIANINLQIERLNLQQRQAEIPLEEKLVSLKIQSIQIQQQMLPLQNQIADIDKQIAAINRENYQQQIQLLKLQQQELPIKNQIADIDEKIAQTQRENYGLQLALNQIAQQMLPIQTQIANVQRQLTDLQRQDYALQRQQLQLRLQMMPMDQEIARIDQQIQDAQREDYDLQIRKLQLQQEEVGYKAQISQIDLQIQNLSRADYELARDKAQADLEALPIKQRIADLEAQITDSVDRQQQLTLQRNQMLAQRAVTVTQRQLDDVNRQLTDLWARFNLRPTGAEAASLVPQIISLEGEKARLENILKPEQDALTSIQRQQEDISFQQDLTTNSLEQQKAAEEALLAPIQHRIDAIQREEDATTARNAVVIAGLEAQKQAIQDLIDPIEQQITAVEALQAAHELDVEITVAGLNKQKELLQQLERPYQEQLNRLIEIQQTTELTNQIQATYLQEELQRLQAVLEPLQEQADAINAEAEAERLRAEAARIGLEQQKQNLQDILKPIEDQITAITREKEAEDLRKQIAIAGLEEQKQKLEDLLKPMQDQLDAIDRQTQSITLQRDLVTAGYDQMKLHLEALRTSEELYKNSLELTEASEKDRLGNLIQQWKDALTASGAFTNQEVIDSATRLNLWGGEASKISTIKDQLNLVTTALTGSGGVNGAFGTVSNTINSGINASMQTLIDKIGNNGSGAIKSFNDLNTVLGSSGLNTAVNNLNTPMSNLATYMSNLSSNAASAYGSINTLNSYMGTLRDNTGQARDNVNSLIGSMNTFVGNINNNSYINPLINLMNTFGGGADSLVYKVTLTLQAVRDLQTGDRGLDTLWYNINNTYRPAVAALGGNFNDLTAAITNTKNAMGSLNAATAKFFATEAAAIAVANRSPSNWTASQIYTQVRDYIAGGAIGFAEGGVVPGPYNQPMMAIVHGGERVIPTSAGAGREPTGVATRSTMNTYNNTIVNNNYNFSANYERQQDPITLSADVRSVIELSRR